MNKLLLLLLALSLAANAAFFVLKPAAPASDRPRMAAPATSSDAAPAAFAKLPPELAAAIASGDEAALRAVGFSEDEARGLVLTRLFTRLAALLREAGSSDPESQARYWQGGNRGRRGSGFTPERQAALNKLEKEFRDTLTKSYGDEDFGFFTGNNRYRFLSPERREQIQRIERDYDEMMADLRKQQEGISLPSDRAKFELLQKEKERDILAALTPEERVLDELRNSASAGLVRSRYGDLIRDEETYKKIYALQKAFDDQYPSRREGGQRSGSADSSARTEAQRRLNEEISSVLGEDAIAAYRRENDGDLKALNALQTRLNLPAGATDQVYALRDTYAAQSQAINANTALTPAQRREQLTALAAQAKAEAAAKLGTEGAEAYAQRSTWIGMLGRGQAFSTDPKDAGAGGNLRSTVFPVRPPGRGSNQSQRVGGEEP